MDIYLVLRSFSGPAGRHSEGDVIKLSEEEARGLVTAGLIKPVKREEQVFETTDTPIEKVEKAVKKPKKKEV